MGSASAWADATNLDSIEAHTFVKTSQLSMPGLLETDADARASHTGSGHVTHCQATRSTAVGTTFEGCAEGGLL